MKRLILVSVVALSGCGGGNGNNGGPDMSAPAGDMAMVMTTTIAQARMGNVMTPITVNAVVIAVNGDDPADTKEWYIQDPAGGPYSGVGIYCNKTAKSNPCPMSITAPALHDLVQVTGTLSTYKGKLELQPTAEMTMMANATPPPVMMTVTAADLAASSTNAGIRGAMAKVTGNFTVDDVTPMVLYNTKCAGEGGVNGSCSGCKPPTYSGFRVNDGASHEIFVENTFYLGEHLQSSPECVSTAPMMSEQVTVGKTFSVLSGIVEVDPYGATANTVVLEPTVDSDYTTP